MNQAQRVALLALLACCWLSPAGAQGTAVLNQAASAAQASQQAAAESQARVNTVVDAQQTLLEQFRAATWQAQQQKVYGQQLKALLEAQEQERQSLQQQLRELDRTERELSPLLLRMVEALNKFVAADLPFLRAERRERLQNLQRALTDPELNIAERTRRVLEAYQVELDYGRSLGWEQDNIDGRDVQLLRLGRTVLYALSVDGKALGIWNNKSRQWEALDLGYASVIKKGLRMARELAAPDLLDLPLRSVGGAP